MADILKRDVTTSGVPASKKSQSLTPIAAAVVAAMSPTHTVFAQDDDGRMDEILVTATKREMNLQDIPHSIDVLSDVQLERMRARDLEATLRALPSVHLVALQPGQNVLTMRGVTTEVFEYTREAQVAVYLDEQPMTSNAQQVGIRNIDIARVENLPGPQGTLFGSSSQTGTLRYITNKPKMGVVEGNVEASAGATKGGEGSWDVNGVINVPLGEKVAARIVGYSSHDGGFVDNVFGTSFSGNYDNADLVENDFNEYDVTGGRLHVSWDISDKWNALVSHVFENTAAVGVWDSDAGLGDFQVTRFEDEFRDDDWTSTALTLTGELGFADLTFTTTHFERDIVYEYDNMTYLQSRDATYGYTCNAGYYYACIYYSNYYSGYIFNDQEQERDAFELRLVSNGDGKMQWTLGAYYEDFQNNWFYGTKIPGLVNTTQWAAANYYAYLYSPNYYNGYVGNPYQLVPLTPTDVSFNQTFQQNIKQTALFGELSYNVTDNLMLFGGIRWAEFDRDKLERNQFPAQLIPFGDRTTGDGSFRDQGSEDDIIYKIGAQYDINEDVMVYGLYSQGFRVGGANSRRAVATGRIPSTFDGDFVNNYEAGIKSQWADGRVTFNASAFYMLFEDYQSGANFPDGEWWLSGTINAGDTENLGVEMTVNWQATDRLALSLNALAAEAEFKDNFCNNFENGVRQPCDTLPDGSIDPNDLDIRRGMDLPNSPDLQYWASIYYEVPDVFGGNLWLYFDHSYSDESWAGTQQILQDDRNGLAPSYTYSNFSMGLQLENQWDITLAVNNVFDDRGFSYSWTGEADNAETFGDPRYRIQRAQFRPLTTWLTVRKGFGGT
ncbi:MAG: TonB-dependent receptor [Pseudomonadota bacterium]